MPYRSAKQRAYMHIHLPQIAARWDAEYGGTVKPRSSKFKLALQKYKKGKSNARIQ